MILIILATFGSMTSCFSNEFTTISTTPPTTSDSSNPNYVHNAEKYTITYIDAPQHNNPTTYTANEYIKLQKAKWPGLSFSHWSDLDGNVVTEIPTGSEGNITLVANWNYIENMLISNDSNEMLFSLYDEQNSQCYFVYEIGTMHNVVLDELSSFKYQGGTQHTWSISEKVSFTKSSANSVAKTIANITSQSNSWSQTTSKARELSKKTNLSYKIALEAMKIKLGEITSGIESLESASSSIEDYVAESTSTSNENSFTYSSSISYVEDKTTEMTKTQLFDPQLTPAGLYRYVLAADIKTFAIITYDYVNKSYFVSIYSYIERTYDTTIYEPLPEYNLNTNIANSEPLTFDIDIDSIASDIVAKSYFVEFDANGGEGYMPKQMIMPDSNANLYKNRFCRDNHIFCGWSLSKDNTTIAYLDEQPINQIVSPQETLVLYAIWAPIEYTVVYDANGGYGKMDPSKHTFKGNEQLTPNTLKKEGSEFVGWNTMPDGSGATYNDGQSIFNFDFVNTDSITLYAQWKKIPTHQVTFNYNGISQIVTVATNTAVTPPAINDELFAGWDKDLSCITKDTVVNAKYLSGISKTVSLSQEYCLDGELGYITIIPETNRIILSASASDLTCVVTTSEGTWGTPSFNITQSVVNCDVLIVVTQDGIELARATSFYFQEISVAPGKEITISVFTTTSGSDYSGNLNYTAMCSLSTKKLNTTGVLYSMNGSTSGTPGTTITFTPTTNKVVLNIQATNLSCREWLYGSGIFDSVSATPVFTVKQNDIDIYCGNTLNSIELYVVADQEITISVDIIYTFSRDYPSKPGILKQECYGTVNYTIYH